MAFLRETLFCLIVAAIAAQTISYAQDDFGQVLLEAFTTGMFDENDAAQANPGPVPSQTPLLFGYPDVTLQPEIPYPSFEMETSTPDEFGVSESTEATWDDFSDESPEISHEANLSPTAEDLLVDNVEETLAPSAEYTSETLDEEFAQTFSELSTNATWSFISSAVEPSQPPIVDPLSTAFDLPSASPVEVFGQFSAAEQETITDALLASRPIRVNCGSFDARNTFMQDINPWFSNDSVAVEDLLASASFSSIPEALLYSTYRYSAENLTYTIPLPRQGMWRVTLQWAEIVPVFMREGARVFTVEMNGIEYESALDVYQDSPLGSFSPLVRTYVADVTDSSLVITLGQKVGETMLSAFQVAHISPFSS